MADFEVIPQEAIDHLTANPGTAAQFDSVFGSGRSQEVLKDKIPEPEDKPDTPEMSFIGKAWDSTGRAVGYGVQEAVNETVDAFESFDIWASQKLDEVGVPSRLQIMDKDGNFDPKFKFYHESLQDTDSLFGGQVSEKGDALELGMVSKTQTTTGAVVSGISQFAAGFAGASKFTKLSGLRGAFVNGAIADALVFDPKDPNVIKMLDEWGVDTGTLGEVLATDPDDPDWINRMRNVTEGAAFGGIVEAIGWGIKAARAGRAGATKEAAEFTLKQDEALKELDAAMKDAGEVVAKDAQESLEFSKKHLIDTDSPLPLDLGDPAVAREVPATTNNPKRLYLTEDMIDNIRLQTSLAKGTTTAAKTAKLSFRSPRTAGSYDEILDDLAGQQAVLSDEFARIKGGDTQRWTTVKAQAAAKLRNMAHMTGEDPEELIKRFQSVNGGDISKMAAEIHAQETYLVNAELELKDMFRAINDHNAGVSVDLSKFPGIRNVDELRLAANQSTEVIVNLLAGTDAARSNIARAMNAMKIAKEGDAQLREMLRQPDVFKNVDEIAKVVSDPKNADVPVSQSMEEALSRFKKIGDEVNTFRINALLSGPGTQQVNFVSNVVNSLVIPTEQFLGGLSKFDRRMMAHSTKQLQGYFAGLLDALQTAAKAGWWDEAILDPFSGKIEEQVFMKSSTALGKMVTLPSRALMTMDELFKQAAYRGRIFADANELAFQKGLKGVDREEFIQTYLNESFTETGAATRGDALLQSRRTTFTEPLEAPAALSLQKLAIDHPPVRFFIPFVRTPLNILSQTYQHFPVLGTATRRYKADIAAGGARAAQARGRQVMGTALVSAAGYLAANGYITGSGPTDSRIRRAWMKNNQPYAFKIVNEDGTVEWISYARLEPLSNILSIAADAVEVMNDEYNEAEKTPIIQSLIMATMENTVNKTFTQGLYDLMQLFQGDAREQKAALNNFLASFVPNVLNQTNGDDALRETRTLTDAVMARTGLYNRVDPKRNVLGEPIVRTLPKYDPLGFTKDDVRVVDPVLDEVTRAAINNQSIAGVPARRIKGPNRIDLSQVPYSETQSLYDKWLELTGEVEIGGKTLREKLTEVVNSRSYKTAPEGILGSTEGTKGSIIRKVVSAYRRKAKAELPELMDIIKAEKIGTGSILKDQVQRNRELFPVTSSTQPVPRAKRRTFEDLLNDK